VCAAVGCTIAPEPPEAPHAVVQLSERYDRPTADLDQLAADQLWAPQPDGIVSSGLGALLWNL